MGSDFRQGMRAGVPVALGYLAVSFTLGLAARQAGLNGFQAAFASLLTNTSAGQFAGFTAMAAGASLLETAFSQVVVNLRYILMSAGLTQKIARETSLANRLLVAFDVTDELFALAVSREGPLAPAFYYGMMLVTIPCWALGTFLGAALGALLPEVLLKAAGVALYAMFIAVIVPPAKANKKVLAVCLAAMALSWLLSSLPFLSGLSAGLRVALVALSLSCAAAFWPAGKEGKNA